MDKRRLLLIVVCSFASAYALHIAARQLRFARGIDGKVVKPAAAVSPASRSLRPNYPYSVIAGGAYTPSELRSAVERDPLISQHYSDFNLKTARLVTLSEDRFQYVSYRLRNHIYWTHNKLRIPRGEELLTDGANFARTRCGNRLSATPRAETAGDQPAEKVLSLPPFTPALLSKGVVGVGPLPPAVEVAPGAAALPFDLPRLAPYVPGQELAGLGSGPQSSPSLQSYPPGLGMVSSGYPPFGSGTAPGAGTAPGSGPTAAGPPSTSQPVVPIVPVSPPVATPAVPVAPVVPISPIFPNIPVLPVGPIAPDTPVPINEVPEPASFSLLAVSVCGWLWLLTRVTKTDRRQAQ